MSPSRRSSFTSRSYLNQLAAPLPTSSSILTPRRLNTERGPHNALDSIPSILESVQPSANYLADRSLNTRFDSTPRISPASEAPEAQDEQRNRVTHLQRDPITDQVSHHNNPISFVAGQQLNEPPDPSPVPIFSSHPPQAAANRSDQVFSASRTADTLTPLRLSQSPSREYTTNASSNAASSTRSQPIEIHIGAIEVRSSAPPPPSDPRPASRDLNSMHAAAPPARPFSRGLTWTYGLVQG